MYNMLFVIVHGQDKYPCLGMILRNVCGGFQTVHLFHAYIHEDDVRVDSFEQVQHLAPRACFGHDSDSSDVLQEHANPGANQSVVVG
jgi:hypothetical protein